MNEQNTDFLYDMLPASWTYCFLDGCPLAAKCIRHLSGTVVPDDVIVGSAVFPTVLRQEQCRFYKLVRIIKAACGFNILFSEVKQKDVTTLHRRLNAYFGSQTSYSRYKRGLKLLTPEQQKWIIDLFASYGYTDVVRFDSFKNVYDVF